MAKKIRNKDISWNKEEHIVPIIRNEQGYLVEADGSYVDYATDKRILAIGYRPKTPYKPDTMKSIIEQYKKAEMVLKLEEDKEVKNEKKIKRSKEILQNLAECLNREKDYVKKHLNIDIANIISNRTK